MATTTPEPELAALPDVAQRFVQDLDKELAKLKQIFEEPKAQYDRLLLIRKNVLSGASGQPLHPEPSTAPNRRGRNRSTTGAQAPRASGDRRMEQFLEAVRQNPNGIAVPDIARVINTNLLKEGETPVKESYLYRVRDKAKRKGLIVREGDNGNIIRLAELTPSPARVAEIAAASKGSRGRDS